MSAPVKNTLLFALVAVMIAISGFMQSWNTALLVINMGLISAIMAIGVNLQWGFAGLFNVGVMGFVALGGLAVVLISMPPVTEAWAEGGMGVILGLQSYFQINRLERVLGLSYAGYVLLLLPSMVWVGYSGYPLEMIAQARLAITVVFFVWLMACIVRYTPVSAGDLLSVLWRPMIAGGAMYAVVTLLHSDGLGYRALSMLQDVSVGALTFTLVLLGLWRVAGRPAGVESFAMGRLGAVARRLASR